MHVEVIRETAVHLSSETRYLPDSARLADLLGQNPPASISCVGVPGTCHHPQLLQGGLGLEAQVFMLAQ